MYFGSCYQSPDDYFQYIDSRHESLANMYLAKINLHYVVTTGYINLLGITWGNQ